MSEHKTQEELPVEVTEVFTDLGYPYYEWLSAGLDSGHTFTPYCEWYATPRRPTSSPTDWAVLAPV